MTRRRGEENGRERTSCRLEAQCKTQKRCLVCVVRSRTVQRPEAEGCECLPGGFLVGDWVLGFLVFWLSFWILGVLVEFLDSWWVIGFLNSWCFGLDFCSFSLPFSPILPFPP